ncbi:MAG: glycosyltransferase, partial [Candidatus Cloacimonetes bacterium]|nr:glycosyltransferase [Candidatus Cloacimonadota bacterium]
MNLSFVIPVLNEEESLEILYNEIKQNIPECDYEIVFIDDGSTDNSFNILTQLYEQDNNIKIIRFRRN